MREHSPSERGSAPSPGPRSFIRHGCAVLHVHLLSVICLCCITLLHRIHFSHMLNTLQPSPCLLENANTMYVTSHIAPSHAGLCRHLLLLWRPLLAGYHSSLLLVRDTPSTCLTIWRCCCALLPCPPCALPWGHRTIWRASSTWGGRPSGSDMQSW